MKTQLEEIFEHQLALTRRFHAIEATHGLLIYLGPIPFDLKNLRAQTQLRLLAWDIVEEIGEAARVPNPIERLGELADVAHFLVELLICSGIQAYDLRRFEYSTGPTRTMYDFLLALSHAMYQLKSKPWKRTFKSSDLTTYRLSLIETFSTFIRMVKCEGISVDQLYNAYLDKASINHQRISS